MSKFGADLGDSLVSWRFLISILVGLPFFLGGVAVMRHGDVNLGAVIVFVGGGFSQMVRTP